MAVSPAVSQSFLTNCVLFSIADVVGHARWQRYSKIISVSGVERKKREEDRNLLRVLLRQSPYLTTTRFISNGAFGPKKCCHK